jgi:hypothetical protein
MISPTQGKNHLSVVSATVKKHFDSAVRGAYIRLKYTTKAIRKEDNHTYKRTTLFTNNLTSISTNSNTLTIMSRKS